MISSQHPHLPPLPVPPNWTFADWFWFLFKNVLGGVLILSSLIVGPLIPGPGGIPLFLIGFALITFPGKRKLTARILRGRPYRLNSRFLHWTTPLIAALLAPALIWWLTDEFSSVRRLALFKSPLRCILTGIVTAAMIWIGLQLLLRVANFFVRQIPRLRRRIRPWLRDHGIDLLPPRRRRRLPHEPPDRRDPEEILEIHIRHRQRAHRLLRRFNPWAKRVVGVIITIGIFLWLFRKIALHWADARAQLLATQWTDFLLASLIFASFLFLFRALVWRRILHGFGHRLPAAAATRIWSTSELARYLPGVIWQVVGRVYLVRPYGVGAALCSTSQMLELVLFLLANLLVALLCLLQLGTKIDPAAGVWLYGGMAIVPLLCFLLHPKILYGLMNRILRWLKKAPITQRLSGRKLLGLLIWTMFGLLWQSLAVWLLTRDALDLKPDHWWIVAGAYCLAWCAGFLAVWAPGGIGVRELVFMAALQLILPHSIRDTHHDYSNGLLASLSLLLRLWTVTGELILASVAYACDYRGALGRSNAPGRTAPRADTPPLPVQLPET